MTELERIKKEYYSGIIKLIIIGICIFILGLIIGYSLPKSCPECSCPEPLIIEPMVKTSCPPPQSVCTLESAQKICDRAMDYAESTERRFE